MLSRAGVKDNRKLILVLIQERTRVLVTGRIESSAFSLSLSSCSFSLAFSLVLLPSFFLSLLQVLSFLPSFLPWDVTRSSGKCTQNKIPHSAVTVRICIIVRSRKNLHTCKLLSLVRDLLSSNMLEAAISVSTLQARHVRARFECPGTLPSQGEELLKIWKWNDLWWWKFFIFVIFWVVGEKCVWLQNKERIDTHNNTVMML